MRSISTCKMYALVIWTLVERHKFYIVYISTDLDTKILFEF